MSYILITNSDGVSSSLVHADNEGAYLANHGVKGQRLGVRRFQNTDVSLTEKEKRRIKTLQGKSDKLDAKKAKLNSPKNMVKLSQYKSLSSDRHAAANQHKADEDFYRNKASYALTNHGAKVATKKADKAHTKYVQEAKKGSGIR